jgi:hypothetical protein
MMGLALFSWIPAGLPLDTALPRGLARAER